MFSKDREGLQALMEKEEICWGEIDRLGQDGERQNFMTTKMPLTPQYRVRGGQRVVIFAPEADADSPNPYMLGLMGRKVPFVVTGIDEEKGWLVGSRKRAQEIIKATMLQDLQNGRVYQGEVTGFSRYGGYVEVNGISGHIRNSDFSEDYSDIREYVSVGDKLDVRCREISQDGYIFWEVLTKLHRTKPMEHDFEAGAVVLGRVVRIGNFERSVGVFVNIALGIDALCPLPRDIEVEEGVRVSMKIDTITPPRKPTDPPRIRGRVLRVC